VEITNINLFDEWTSAGEKQRRQRQTENTCEGPADGSLLFFTPPASTLQPTATAAATISNVGQLAAVARLPFARA